MPMTPEQERLYEQGGTAAWLQILQLAMRHLGTETPVAARWQKERAEIVAALRSVCGDYGDNDWSDDLHLADVVEKHLGRHLNGRASQG